MSKGRGRGLSEGYRSAPEIIDIETIEAPVTFSAKSAGSKSTFRAPGAASQATIGTPRSDGMSHSAKASSKVALAKQYPHGSMSLPAGRASRKRGVREES